MINPLNKIYYIYTLTCPIDNKVRYVGCTINPRQRLSAHLNVESEQTKKKKPWLDKLRELKLIPLMDIVKSTENLEEAAIFENEIYDKYNSEYMTCKDPRTKKYIETRPKGTVRRIRKEYKNG